MDGVFCRFSHLIYFIIALNNTLSLILSNEIIIEIVIKFPNMFDLWDSSIKGFNKLIQVEEVPKIFLSAVMLTHGDRSRASSCDLRWWKQFILRYFTSLWSIFSLQPDRMNYYSCNQLMLKFNVQETWLAKEKWRSSMNNGNKLDFLGCTDTIAETDLDSGEKSLLQWLFDSL